MNLTEGSRYRLIDVVGRDGEAKKPGFGETLMVNTVGFPVLAVSTELARKGVALTGHFQPHLGEAYRKIRFRWKGLWRVNRGARSTDFRSRLELKASVVFVTGIVIPKRK